jgi:hypothetical protein
MARFKPNPGLHPPMGYVFVDKATGQEFTGSDWDDVARQVENYRRANGLPVGRPLEECHRRFCRDFPRFCGDTAKRVSVSHTSLGARVVSWVARFLSGNLPKPVDKHTARNRAAICTKCPSQSDWKAHCGCNVNALNSMKKQWLKMSGQKPVAETENLAACADLGEECSLSTWAQQPPRDVGQPRNCWRLNA